MNRPSKTASQITLLSETDVTGKIRFVNDAFCDISKYSRAELLGQPHSIIRHPDMPKSLFTYLWNTILRGEIFKAVIKNKAGDGSAYWVNATIMAIRDPNNEIEKCIGVRHLIPDVQFAEKAFEEQLRLLKL
jgi:methyl-accepting chemotaxis protein